LTDFGPDGVPERSIREMGLIVLKAVFARALRTEESDDVAAQVLDGFAGNLRALGGLGEDEGALKDRLDEVADAFGGPGCVGGVEILGGLDVSSEGFNVRGERVLAGGADVGVGRVGLLDKGAEQAGVVGQFAGENSGAEFEVAEEAVDGVLGVVVGRGGEESSGALFPVVDGSESEIILGLEVVEEAALSDAGFAADVVNGSGGVAFGANDMEGSIEQPEPGLVWGWLLGRNCLGSIHN
jgi:hypothetical protein